MYSGSAHLKIIIKYQILLLESPCSSVRPLVTKFQPSLSGVLDAAWAPEGREGRSQAGPKGHQLEVGARRAP